MTIHLIASILISFSVAYISWYCITIISEQKIIRERFDQYVRARTMGMIASRKSGKNDDSSIFFNDRKKTSREAAFKQLLGLMMALPLSVIWCIADPKTPAIKFAMSFLAIYILQRLLKVQAVRKRKSLIEEELPGMIDLLLICVEAGMSINASLVRVASENKKSILAGEFRATYHELNAGITHETAFQHLAERTQVEDVQSLAVTIIQSEKLGMGLVETLRNQAQLLRETLRMRTKEKIMKVPVKLLIPLVTCIMPAIFMVLVGPAFIQIMAYFSAK